MPDNVSGCFAVPYRLRCSPGPLQILCGIAVPATSNISQVARSRSAFGYRGRRPTSACQSK
jgi:hypothetical protein